MDNIITPKEREKIKNDLIKAGAIERKKPLTSKDDYYSRSIGEKNKPIVRITI